MLKLKSLCMFLVILLTLFSLSLGFSFSVYLGMYWVMIPSNILQQQEIFFTYKPIDTQQKNLIKEEAKQGDSMFAHILNDIPMPKLKMVTTLPIINNEAALKVAQDKTSIQRQILSFLGLEQFSSDGAEEIPIYMGKETYSLDLVLHFYKHNQKPYEHSGVGSLT